jgi:hypothetical protein
MKRASLYVFVCALIMVPGCGRSVRTEYSRHRVLYCGWLDLREGDYRQVGYNSRAEWGIIIKRINTYFLQKSVADYCGSFRVVGASGRADAPPAGSYHLKFNLVDFDHTGAAMTVNVRVIDSANKRVMTSFTSHASGVKNYGSLVFMGRMSQMCQDVARDVADHMYR